VCVAVCVAMNDAVCFAVHICMFCRFASECFVRSAHTNMYVAVCVAVCCGGRCSVLQ